MINNNSNQEFLTHMIKFRLFVYLVIVAIVLSGCSGMKTLTIQTQEPAQVTLPKDIKKLLIVDNAVSQPSDIGHIEKRLGKSTSVKASSGFSVLLKSIS